MKNQRLYLVCSATLLVVFMIGIGIGTSRCSQRETVEQGQTKDDESQTLVIDKQDKVETSDSSQETTKSNEQSQQLTVENSDTKQDTTSSFEEWNAGNADENESDNNNGEVEDKNENESEDSTLSSSVTDEYSDKKWSPFY